ncbi:unnamed protein product [Microthlaspi erraticum]|uniref:CCHC-type domain-containing protein n=1 Tax=Microthlaspi erraticum TaxID=1685480 RepID=A0A6D2IEF3_9BRAS|nr:unnamed protein product [Microthlaspi erraticum]
MPCRICDGYGHYTHACPSERMSRVTCYTCGLRGQYIASCPTTHPTPSSSSGTSTSARARRSPRPRRGRNSGHSRNPNPKLHIQKKQRFRTNTTVEAEFKWNDENPRWTRQGAPEQNWPRTLGYGQGPGRAKQLKSKSCQNATKLGGQEEDAKTSSTVEAEEETNE